MSTEQEQKQIIRGTFWSNLFKKPTESQELESVLKSMLPFEKLNAKYLRLLIELMHNRVYAEGEYIFYQGDPGIGLYIIRDGEVSIVQQEGEKTQKELTRLGRGDFFGELAMLDDEIRSASAVAVKETSVTVIFKPDLQEFIEKYPSKGIHILRGFAQMIAIRLRRLNKDYSDLYNEFLELKRRLKNENQ